MTLGQNVKEYEKRVELEKRVNSIRKKYGSDSVRKGVTLCDKQFGRGVKPSDKGIVTGVRINSDQDGED